MNQVKIKVQGFKKKGMPSELNTSNIKTIIQNNESMKTEENIQSFFNLDSNWNIIKTNESYISKNQLEEQNPRKLGPGVFIDFSKYTDGIEVCQQDWQDLRIDLLNYNYNLRKYQIYAQNSMQEDQFKMDDIQKANNSNDYSVLQNQKQKLELITLEQKNEQKLFMHRLKKKLKMNQDYIPSYFVDKKTNIFSFDPSLKNEEKNKRIKQNRKFDFLGWLKQDLVNDTKTVKFLEKNWKIYSKNSEDQDEQIEKVNHIYNKLRSRIQNQKNGFTKKSEQSPSSKIEKQMQQNKIQQERKEQSQQQSFQTVLQQYEQMEQKSSKSLKQQQMIQSEYKQSFIQNILANQIKVSPLKSNSLEKQSNLSTIKIIKPKSSKCQIQGKINKKEKGKKQIRIIDLSSQKMLNSKSLDNSFNKMSTIDSSVEVNKEGYSLKLIDNYYSIDDSRFNTQNSDDSQARIRIKSKFNSDNSKSFDDEAKKTRTKSGSLTRVKDLKNINNKQSNSSSKFNIQSPSNSAQKQCEQVTNNQSEQNRKQLKQLHRKRKIQSNSNEILFENGNFIFNFYRSPKSKSNSSSIIKQTIQKDSFQDEINMSPQQINEYQGINSNKKNIELNQEQLNLKQANDQYDVILNDHNKQFQNNIQDNSKQYLERRSLSIDQSNLNIPKINFLHRKMKYLNMNEIQQISCTPREKYLNENNPLKYELYVVPQSTRELINNPNKIGKYLYQKQATPRNYGQYSNTKRYQHSQLKQFNKEFNIKIFQQLLFDFQ